MAVIFKARPECLVYQPGPPNPELIQQLEEQDAFCQIYTSKQVLKELQQLSPEFGQAWPELAPARQVEVALLFLSYVHDGETVLTAELEDLDLRAFEVRAAQLGAGLVDVPAGWMPPVVGQRAGQFLAYRGGRACPTSLAMLEARLGPGIPLLAARYQPARLATALALEI